MNDDILFIVQYNPQNKELKLTSISDARALQKFNFQSVNANENEMIRLKTSFISPSRICSSSPLVYDLIKPAKPTPLIHGYLYNFYAATDFRNIANTGWHVPSTAEFASLESYLIANGYNYDDTISGDKIAKSLASADRWAYSSTPGTPGNPDFASKRNRTGLTCFPGGRRSETGQFIYMGEQFYSWTSTQYTVTRAYCRYLNNTSVSFNETNAYKRLGCYIRLFKDSTNLSHGQIGLYIGNDGKKYKTICIGNREILASNLAETLYRNGEAIPNVPINSDWSVLASGARCAYNNDEGNV